MTFFSLFWRDTKAHRAARFAGLAFLAALAIPPSVLGQSTRAGRYQGRLHLRIAPKSRVLADRREHPPPCISGELTTLGALTFDSKSVPQSTAA
jgi:hypothetical protein